MDGEPHGLRMKNYLMEVLSKEHKRLNPDKHDIKIADVNFYYPNADIIDLLTARTTAINNNNWARLTELNHQLTHQVRLNAERVCTPIGAFVTFHDEYSYNEMEAYSSINVLGTVCKIRKAPEPTNIIWENIGFKTSKRTFRVFVIFIAAIIIFIISFKAMKHTANRSAFFLEKYDHSIPCNTLLNFYGEENLSTFAADEYEQSEKSELADTNPEDNTMHVVAPILSCFCNSEKKKYPLDILLEWTYETYKTSSGKDVATCSEIFLDEYKAKFIGY